VKKLKVKDLPVVILAAGLSKRFNEVHRKTHKSLLKIDSDNSIFDIILKELQVYGIKHVFPILGFKANDFNHYFSNPQYKSLTFKPIIANENYIHGPMFTLLSILPYFPKEYDKVVLVPSDTLVYPQVLDQVYSTSVEQNNDFCQLFTFRSLKNQISELNSKIPFSPQKITNSSPLFSLLKQDNTQNSQEYLLPIAVISRSFLLFAQKSNPQKSNKVIQHISRYYETSGNCSLTRIQYQGSIPPFIDIDTSQIYSTLISVKEEIFKAYKYK
jgi:choline kinase